MRYATTTKAALIMLVLSIAAAPMLQAVGTPSEVTTLAYRDFDYILLDGDRGEIDLSLISSEYDPGALSIEKIQFYPSTNVTKYRIESLDVDPGPDFEPGLKRYYFQDHNSGQVFIIKIDLTSLEAPPNDLEANYTELQLEYEQLFDDYENISAEYLELINTAETIMDYLSIYVDTANLTADEAVQEILLNLTATHQLLIDQLANYTELKSIYNHTLLDLNETTIQYDDLLLAHGNLSIHYTEINETLNKTKNELQDKRNNLTSYENFYLQLTGPPEGWIFFKGESYRPLTYYQQEIQSLQNSQGLFPGIVVLAIIAGFVIGIIFYKTRPKKNLETDATIQANTKYGPLSRIVDNFSSGGISGVKNLFLKPTPSAAPAAPSMITPPTSQMPPTTAAPTFGQNVDPGNGQNVDPPTTMKNEEDRPAWLQDIEEHLGVIGGDVGSIKEDLSDVKEDMSGVKKQVKSLQGTAGNLSNRIKKIETGGKKSD